jgi:hypothetical protein
MTTMTTTSTWRFRCCDGGWGLERHTVVDDVASCAAHVPFAGRCPQVLMRAQSWLTLPKLSNFEVSITRTVRHEESLQATQFMFVNVFAQGVGMGMRKHPVVAVDGAEHAVEKSLAGLEVIRGWLLLGWKLRFFSHSTMAELGPRLGSIGRQAAKWQQWLSEKPLDPEGPTSTWRAP